MVDFSGRVPPPIGTNYTDIGNTLVNEGCIMSYHRRRIRPLLTYSGIVSIQRGDVIQS